MFSEGFLKVASDGSERLKEILRKWQEHNKRLPQPSKVIKPAVSVTKIVKAGK